MPYKLINDEQGQAYTPESEENIGQRALRIGARGLVRAGETALGAPGNIANAILGGLGSITTDPTYAQKAQEVSGYMPTTEKIREKVTQPLAEKYLPKGYLEPKTEAGETFDWAVNFLTDLLLPAGVLGKIGKIKKFLPSTGIKKALQIVIPSSAAGYAAKKLGKSEKTVEKIRFGTALLSSIGNPLALKKYGKFMWPTQREIFLEELEKASKIHNTLNKLPVIGYLKSHSVSPTVQSLLGVGYGLIKKSPLAKVAGLGIGSFYALGHIEKVIRMLATNKNLRNAYLTTLKAAARKDTPILLKSIIKLDSIARKENLDKKFPEVPKKSNRFKLIID